MLTVKTGKFADMADVRKFINRNAIKVEGLVYVPEFLNIKSGRINGKYVLFYRELEDRERYGRIY